MAMNPYFPIGYNNPYQYQAMQMQQQMQPVQTAQPNAQSNIIWVQGIEAMKSYPVSAGQNVLLMDSETQCFGIKAADASGMPLPLRIFDYSERTSQTQSQKTAESVDLSCFVTRDEFEALKAEIAAPKRKARKDDENAE